ncbi:LGFP repeat-containing protein [Nocardia cyriacigeorgica]|uniref:LGFP repeat-containing protein n=1 Tax=Nocardia cyriacigeorgica TaxID=135487 RepID=UPI0021579E02|nr:hypothetical protein [Nocardia cyriacigeorgica]
MRPSRRLQHLRQPHHPRTRRQRRQIPGLRTQQPIYWSAATGAHIIWGSIRDTWLASDAENGRYGYPTSDEYDHQGGKAQDTEHPAPTDGVEIRAQSCPGSRSEPGLHGSRYGPRLELGALVAPATAAIVC